MVSDVYQILEDATDKHVRWITEMRAEGTLKWKFWHRYELYLKSKMAGPTLNQLDNLTTDILDRLSSPKTPGPWDRRGMVVGQVQSGKTSNYIGLINKAADAGYKFIIVLAGLHDSLRTQTQIRVDAGFLGFNTQATMNFAKANNQIGVGKFNKSLAANALTTSNYDGDFSKSSARKSGLNIKGTDPVILVIKKNTSILRNLIQWVAGQGETKPGGNKLVENVPMLLIDDEADNASINVSRDSISTTNGLIRSLLVLFEQSAYVGYTATPFANIFVPMLNEELVKGLNIKIKTSNLKSGKTCSRVTLSSIFRPLPITSARPACSVCPLPLKARAGKNRCRWSSVFPTRSGLPTTTRLLCRISTRRTTRCLTICLPHYCMLSNVLF